MSDFIFIPLGIILWALAVYAVIAVCFALTIIVDAVLALLGK